MICYLIKKINPNYNFSHLRNQIKKFIRKGDNKKYLYHMGFVNIKDINLLK